MKFILQRDDTITMHVVMPDARRVRGLLISPHAKALNVQQQHEAVGRHLMRKHAPLKRMGNFKRRAEQP